MYGKSIPIPRDESIFGDDLHYEYRSSKIEAAPWPDFLLKARDRIHALSRYQFNFVVAEYNKKRPVWLFRPTPENIEWLEEERWDDDNGKPESDAMLLNRKLDKLRKLEQQGF